MLEQAVLTDRAPFEYRYLSRRLLTQLIKHDEAVRRRARRTIAVSMFGLTVSAQRSTPDYENLSDLAGRSLELVSDHVGGLDCSWCPHLHAELDLHEGVFAPLMGWDGGEVACYCGTAVLPGGERVFVGLLGSAANLTGYQGPPEGERGFHPSDMAGLYSLIEAVRETDDPEVDLEYRIDDHSLEREAVLELAMDFTASGARGCPVRLEFLARQLLGGDGYHGRHGEFDRVMIGAPLWAATPRPVPEPIGMRR
jgi:hypothetical protein